MYPPCRLLEEHLFDTGAICWPMGIPHFSAVSVHSPDLITLPASLHDG